MKLIDILYFLGDLGGRFPKQQFGWIEHYFRRMIRDGRVIALYKDGALHGILAFSLCIDYIPYWKKKTWEYRKQQVDGKTFYVELLAARNWTKEVRREFEKEVLRLYPQIERAIWHKWAEWGDRKVTWRRQWAMK